MLPTESKRFLSSGIHWTCYSILLEPNVQRYFIANGNLLRIFMRHAVTSFIFKGWNLLMTGRITIAKLHQILCSVAVSIITITLFNMNSPNVKTVSSNLLAVISSNDLSCSVWILLVYHFNAKFMTPCVFITELSDMLFLLLLPPPPLHFVFLYFLKHLQRRKHVAFGISRGPTQRDFVECQTETRKLAILTCYFICYLLKAWFVCWMLCFDIYIICNIYIICHPDANVYTANDKRYEWQIVFVPFELHVANLEIFNTFHCDAQ